MQKANFMSAPLPPSYYLYVYGSSAFTLDTRNIGKEFVLQYVVDSTSSSGPTWSEGKGHYTPSMISLAHPVILGECLPDLPFKDAHVDLIRTMYGLSSFVLLRPKVTTGPFATSLSQSESSTLLSSLRLAVLARGSSLPFFVTRHAASRFSFVGQCLPGTNGASTITFSSASAGCEYTSGLTRSGLMAAPIISSALMMRCSVCSLLA